MPLPKRGKTFAQIVTAAREGRHKPTPAENRLWQALRDRRLNGLKFRRQYPFGRFILDLYCVAHQLVIEVDGGIHQVPEQAQSDAARTEYLQLQGLQILRFTNQQVEDELEAVLAKILEATTKPRLK